MSKVRKVCRALPVRKAPKALPDRKDRRVRRGFKVRKALLVPVRKARRAIKVIRERKVQMVWGSVFPAWMALMVAPARRVCKARKDH